MSYPDVVERCFVSDIIEEEESCGKKNITDYKVSNLLNIIEQMFTGPERTHTNFKVFCDTQFYSIITGSLPMGIIDLK